MRIKKIIIFTIPLTLLVFLFAPADLPDNSEFSMALDSLPRDKILIVFNSGGWGNTPLDKAEDFLPIIGGIQKALSDMGHESVVVPYERTKNSFLGKIEGLRGFVNSFRAQSDKLVQEIEEFKMENPDSKIIITGLSSGAAFVDNVMKEVSEKEIDNVFAIEVGTPFWEDPFESENILFLDNEGEDPLSAREIKELIISLIKAPGRLIVSSLKGRKMPFSHAFYTPGHDYEWETNSTGKRIVSFLEDKFEKSDKF